MPNVPNRSQIRKGKHVFIETKENQRTGNLIEVGIIAIQCIVNLINSKSKSDL